MHPARRSRWGRRTGVAILILATGAFAVIRSELGRQITSDI